MTDRLKLEVRPMHPSLTQVIRHRPDQLPLLRPAPTPTRVVTVRPYTLPDVLRDLAVIRPAVKVGTVRTVVCADTNRGPGCGETFETKNPDIRRCPSCRSLRFPKPPKPVRVLSVTQATRQRARDEARRSEARRVRRDRESPEMQAGNQ